MLTQLNLLKRKTESLTTDVLLRCCQHPWIRSSSCWQPCLLKTALTLSHWKKERMLIFNIFCITIVKME